MTLDPGVGLLHHQGLYLTALVLHLPKSVFTEICYIIRHVLSLTTPLTSDCACALQLASALAHLHSLQPEVPHGRLSTSIIAVTSAAEISLSRCISAPVPQDRTPSSKRMHVVDSSSQFSGSLECEPDPLVPEAIKPSRSIPRFLAGPIRRSTSGVSAAFATSPHHSPQFDAIQRRHSVAGPVDSVSDSLSLASRALFVQRQAAPWRRGSDSIDTAMHALSLQPGGSSETAGDGAAAGDADESTVSSTELPGVGMVFKVSVPGKRSNSARESLFEAAEAAVWSKSGVYSVVTPLVCLWFSAFCTAHALHRATM